MLNFVKALFSSGTVMQNVENIATEWIETDKEKAEAKTVFIKALDPNGAMRRQLSRDVTTLYKLYLFVLLTLIVLEFFGFGGMNTPVGAENATMDITSATQKITDLFMPITSLFGIIVTASFGVNYANIKKGETQ